MKYTGLVIFWISSLIIEIIRYLIIFIWEFRFKLKPVYTSKDELNIFFTSEYARYRPEVRVRWKSSFHALFNIK